MEDATFFSIRNDPETGDVVVLATLEVDATLFITVGANPATKPSVLVNLHFVSNRDHDHGNVVVANASGQIFVITDAGCRPTIVVVVVVTTHLDASTGQGADSETGNVIVGPKNKVRVQCTAVTTIVETDATKIRVLKGLNGHPGWHDHVAELVVSNFPGHIGAIELSIHQWYKVGVGLAGVLAAEKKMQ